jgi:hypothetical protein
MASRQLSFAQRVSALEQQYLSAFPRTPTKDQQSLSDRIRRALSWMKRAASVSHEDRPPRYVDLWIAFNALYGQRYYGNGTTNRNDTKTSKSLCRCWLTLKQEPLNSGNGQANDMSRPASGIWWRINTCISSIGRGTLQRLRMQ